MICQPRQDFRKFQPATKQFNSVTINESKFNSVTIPTAEYIPDLEALKQEHIQRTNAFMPSIDVLTHNFLVKYYPEHRHNLMIMKILGYYNITSN